MNQRYLDPAALARVGNLELIARQVVEGFVSGRHRSPYHGFSVEYADHRPYVPGDELRSVDWKALARTDRYYVKLYEEETNLRAHIVLDASASMNFKQGAELDKFSYGAYLAAALSYLLIRQSDAVGLALVDNGIRQLVPARATPVHFRRLLDTLGEAAAQDDTALAPALHELAERVRGRGLVIVISDMIDDLDAMMAGLQHLRHRRHEVIVFHLIDPAERDFPYAKSARFKDMEGAGQLVANPKALRAAYLDRFGKFVETLATECHRNRIGHHVVSTDQPYAEFLGHFLDKRSRLG
jgi:uncharacterized protein (DUF58 family)